MEGVFGDGRKAAVCGSPPSRCNEPAAMAERYTALHRNILDTFNEYGVQIMTPAYEDDPERAKIVPKDCWYSFPAKPASRRKAVRSGSS